MGADGGTPVCSGCPNGSNGYYFKFDKLEIKKYFGIEMGDAGVQKAVKQCQNGLVVKSGTVWFFPPHRTYTVYFGSWVPSLHPSAGDWRTGDYIVKPEDECAVSNI